MKLQRYSISGDGMGGGCSEKDDMCGSWVMADEAILRIEELERNLADLQESVKAQHRSDLVGATDTQEPELPPGWEVREMAPNWWVSDHLGSRRSVRTTRACAVDSAWWAFGLTRERYRQLLACERFVREMVDAHELEWDTPGVYAQAKAILAEAPGEPIQGGG